MEEQENTKWGKTVIVLRVLLDEMFAGLKEYLQVLGWEVLTVQEVGLQGARDRDVVEYAKENGLLLLTQDSKPAELAELLGVRYVLISNALIAKVADEKIREKYPDAKKA
jgi:predicted nuclease of predicted toxin-antitoxin system